MSSKESDIDHLIKYPEMGIQSQSEQDVDDNFVRILDSEGNFRGTGFFIKYSQEYCVTCHHCICDLDQIFIGRTKDTKYNAQWIEEYSEPKYDIAFLKVEDNPFKPLLYGKDTMGHFKVTVRGFSGKNIDNLPEGTSVEHLFLSDIAKKLTFPKEEIVGQNRWNVKPDVYVLAYYIKGKFEQGFSGSPVCYYPNYKVVGMFIAKDEDEYGYVIPIQTIISKFEIKINRYSENEYFMSHSNRNIKGLFEKGNQYFEDERYTEAITQFDEIIKDPNYINAVCNKGRSLTRLGKRAESLKYFEFVLHIDPKNVYALNGKGFALNGKGLTPDGKERAIIAIEWFDKALEIDPNYTTPLFNKAYTLHIHLEKLKEAKEYYSEVLKLKPNHQNALKFYKMVDEELKRQNSI